MVKVPSSGSPGSFSLATEARFVMSMIAALPPGPSKLMTSPSGR